MKPTSPARQLVSFPLEDIVNELLGGQESVVISKPIAEILLMVTKNKHTCYIQMPGDENLNIFSEPITECVLWNLQHWRNSVEKWLRARKYSDDQRKAKFVQDANVKLVARAILKTAYINPDAATVIAWSIVKNKDWAKAKALGVKRIIERAEEI